MAWGVAPPPPMCVLGWGNSMCGRGLRYECASASSMTWLQYLMNTNNHLRASWELSWSPVEGLEWFLIFRSMWLFRYYCYFIWPQELRSTGGLFIARHWELIAFSNDWLESVSSSALYPAYRRIRQAMGVGSSNVRRATRISLRMETASAARKHCVLVRIRTVLRSFPNTSNPLPMTPVQLCRKRGPRWVVHEEMDRMLVQTAVICNYFASRPVLLSRSSWATGPVPYLSRWNVWAPCGGALDVY